jgi:hypothetical protein
MPKERDLIPSISPQVKRAIQYMVDTKADILAAAAHAGMKHYELRRQLGKPHVRQYGFTQRQIAIEAFCLGSPAALSKVRDESENGMAVVAAVKAGEMLKIGAIEAEAAGQRRLPGLQIVIVEGNGSERVAFQPPQQMPPLLDVTPPEHLLKEAEPAIAPDAEAE